MKKFLLFVFAVITLIGEDLNFVYSKAEKLNESKEYVGSIYSHSETIIATRVIGYIKNINIEEGDIIKKGDILFEVDPSDIDSALQQAEVGLLSAKIQYLDAKKDYDRFKVLKEKGVTPERDFEKIELNLELRELSLKMAQASLEQAKAQYKYTTVKSPIDGIVIKKNSKNSELVSPGQPVLVISNLKDLRVKALVKESDIVKLKVGMFADVYVASVNKNIKTKIISIVPSGDASTHSYQIKSEIEDAKDLLPGMFAKIKIDLSQREAVVIDSSAITTRGGITGVFTIVNNLYKFIPVVIGSENSARVEVFGLDADIKCINYPQAFVQDNKQVQ